MKSVKITFEQMQGLITRSVILANKQNELKFLRTENKLYWDDLVKKYNLDPDTTYDIDQANNTLIRREKEK